LDIKQLVNRTVVSLSLNTRLVSSHVFVTLISVILISVFAREAIYRAAREDVEHHMEDLAFTASKRLEEPLEDYLEGQGSLEAVRQAAILPLRNNQNIQYSLYSRDGSFLFDSDPGIKGPGSTSPEVSRVLEGNLSELDVIRPDALGVDTIYVAFIVGHGEETYGVYILRTPLEQALEPARRYFFWLLFSALLVIIAVGALGGLLAHSLAGPVDRLTSAAERLARGDLNVRIEPEGTPEMTRLTQAFNAMASRLQKNIEELRGFVANASHELRTPLTTVKLRVEALRAGALQDSLVAERFLTEIEEQTDRMSRMVNDLLDLSRIESGIEPGERTALKMGEIVSQVSKTFRVRAENSGIQMVLQIDPGLPQIQADEDQIWRVVMNLLDNAITYTSKKGRVDLRVKSTPDNRWIRVEVQDTGFGISSKELPHIFERFYRSENTRQRKSPSRSSGLGLAIAKSIIENHGGKIGVNSRLGEGSLFWFELPVI
jgi:signal transduction histidine kinase